MAQKITNVIMLIYPVKNISFIISKVTTGTLLMALQEVRNHQGQQDLFLANVCARFVVQKQR